MNNEMCFSLYAVEAKVGEEKTCLDGQDYHGFLVLRDETPGRDPCIVEELDFIMQRHGLEEGQKPYVHAVSKVGTDRDFSALEKHGYIGGSAEVMQSIWAEALDIGYEIGQLQREFSNTGGADGINCRAGVKAVIDGLGLSYTPVIEGGGGVTIGTQSDLISEIPERHFEL